MQIKLQRTSNNNCYLFGKISSDKNFDCDSLEMGDENRIEIGTYLLKMSYNRDHTAQFISIWSQDNDFISVFVRNNNEIHYGIEIRKNNNFITIGQKKGHAYIENQNLFYWKLQKLIEECLDNGEVIELLVLNYVEISQ